MFFSFVLFFLKKKYFLFWVKERGCFFFDLFFHVFFCFSDHIWPAPLLAHTTFETVFCPNLCVENFGQWGCSSAHFVVHVLLFLGHGPPCGGPPLPKTCAGSPVVVWVCRCCVVLCCVVLCRCGVMWHAENLRVYIQNVPVCRQHAHMLFNIFAWCRHTRGRFEWTHAGHGGVIVSSAFQNLPT